MRTEAQLPSAGAAFAVQAGTLAGIVVAVAVALSAVVFSEPAIADVLMVAVIGAIPILGTARFGRVTLINAAAWLVIVALGVAGTQMSATFDTAIKHQLITLFLALGAFVLAGYVAADPEPRWKLIMWCYVLACLGATAAAFAGTFRLVPGAYDLFTNFDRARGTFKDPNVYGAALVPALVFLGWIMLREPVRRAALAAAVALPLAVGLLISFSRGAWISAALAVFLLALITFVRSRRRSDLQRFAIVAVVGLAGLAVAVAAALQVKDVRALLDQRASMDQSYDLGPDGRFGGQEKARRLILANPLGIGTHTFRDVYHHEEPHNVYLTMFLNAGWLGGLVYIASVLMTAGAGLWRSLRNDVLQGPLIVSSVAFVAVTFEGIVIDTDHWRHFFLIMACVWGLVDAGRPVVDTSRRRTD